MSPINVTNFQIQLNAHPDRRKVDYVLNGFRYGFNIGFHPHLPKLKSAISNCPSAYEHLSIIDEYLAKEVKLGRVFGPTSTPISDYELAYQSFWGYPKEGQRLAAYPGPIIPIRAQCE